MVYHVMAYSELLLCTYQNVIMIWGMYGVGQKKKQSNSHWLWTDTLFLRFVSRGVTRKRSNEIPSARFVALSYRYARVVA